MEGEGALGIGQGVTIEQALGERIGGGALGFKPVLGTLNGLIGLLCDGEGQGGFGLDAQREILGNHGKRDERKQA